MTPVFSIDFQKVPPEAAVVPVMDRGFLYGDSVYEVVRTYRGKIPFLLDRHYRRLLHSAEQIGLRIPFSFERLDRHLVDCMVGSPHPDHYIRIIVSRGEDDRFDLYPQEKLVPRTVILVDRIKVFPKEYYESGVGVALVSIRRNPRQALDPNIKSGNYLNNVIAIIEAKKRGAADAVMLNVEDCIAEATASNIFMVKGGVIQTPQMESGILDGISRGLLKEIFHRERIPFEERRISRQEFLSADEVFLTGTVKEIMPVATIDGVSVGSGKPGTVTGRVIEQFRKEVERIVSSRGPGSSRTT
ncbi:MAG: aminotransferase class IV [Pseudomonadota bacterium]